MRTTTRDVEDWIKKLKYNGIKEFQFKDLPDDLKKIGMIKKSKVIGLIKVKKKIKDVAIWEIVDCVAI